MNKLAIKELLEKIIEKISKIVDSQEIFGNLQGEIEDMIIQLEDAIKKKRSIKCSRT
jgi:ribosomal protein S13